MAPYKHYWFIGNTSYLGAYKMKKRIYISAILTVTLLSNAAFCSQHISPDIEYLEERVSEKVHLLKEAVKQEVLRQLGEDKKSISIPSPSEELTPMEDYVMSLHCAQCDREREQNNRDQEQHWNAIKPLLLKMVNKPFYDDLDDPQIPNPPSTKLN